MAKGRDQQPVLVNMAINTQLLKNDCVAGYVRLMLIRVIFNILHTVLAVINSCSGIIN